MRRFILILAIVISTIFIQSCGTLKFDVGKIYFDENPTAKILDKKDLDERIFNFYQVDSNNFVFLGANYKEGTWYIRNYSLNKEFKLLNKIDAIGESEFYIYSGIYNNNFVLVSSINYDKYNDDNFNIYMRYIDLKNGKVISEKKIYKYPVEEEVKINDDEETFDNYRAYVINSSNKNFFSIVYKSYCDYTEQYRIIGSVFDKNSKELYHFTKIYREKESIEDILLSNKGELFFSTFLFDEDNEKKDTYLYKISKNVSKELKYELPEEILDEDDYKVYGSRIGENKDGKIIVASSLGGDYLLGILLAKYDDDKNEYSKTNMFEIDEDVAENLNDYNKLTGATAFIHFSFFGNNNMILIFEELKTVTYKTKTSSSTYGIRGPIYFMTFNKDFKPMWQNNIKDRKVTVVENDVYAGELNDLNCIKNYDNKIDFYVSLNEPEYGYYKYEIDPEKNIFKGPKLLFEYSGSFALLKRKFIKTKKGLLFVTVDSHRNIFVGQEFHQKLYLVDFK